VLFFCQNNFWAISVPGKIQCSAPTVAQRGLAYGMECFQCDGNDIFAVVKTVRDAAKFAREKSRPVFIEAVTYRLGDHTTADDARRYRDQAEVDMWKQRDPILRVRALLKEKGIWNDSKEAALKERAEKEVTAAVERAENITPPQRAEFFDHMYAELNDDLRLQRDTMQTHSLGEDPSQIESPSHASSH
jgi:TPP-dependent pyruvate/acetoin dehydrogenase alpha subunit